MKAAGRLKPDDEDPVYPHSRQYLFDVFDDLHETRGSNGFGVNPIGYADIATYLDLMKKELTPWDIRQIRVMDRVMLKAMRLSSNREAKAAKGKK